MGKINYTIKRLYKNIYLIESKNTFDLAMMFFRAQEFYENPKYKNQNASFWELFSYYAGKDGIFSYADDYIGFNLSSDSLFKFYSINKHNLTPWDFELLGVVGRARAETAEKFYIIGAREGDKNTVEHELAHAFYSISPDYKKEMDLLTGGLTTREKKSLHKSLSDFKYHPSVFKDEIQAYCVDKRAAGSMDKILKKHRRDFRKVFLKYKKKII